MSSKNCLVCKIETNDEWQRRYLDDYGKLQTTVFKVDFITNSQRGN